MVLTFDTQHVDENVRVGRNACHRHRHVPGHEKCGIKIFAKLSQKCLKNELIDFVDFLLHDHIIK